MSFFLKRMTLGLFMGVFYLAEALFLPRSVVDLPRNKPVRVVVATYDRSGQAVHPDILPPARAGEPYVLAMTPYPFSNDHFENPSLLVSADGLRFREERRSLNPLVPAPTKDHNDDPDLLAIDGSYDLFYLETLRPERQNLVLLRSRDRVSWSRSTVASYKLDGSDGGPFIVSPALVADGRKLLLYYVNTSVQPYRIEYLSSDRVDEWDPGAPRQVVFDKLPVTPWHVNIIQGAGEYYMLITDVSTDGRGGRTYDLYTARSPDLVHWVFGSKVFASKPFGCRNVYRSSGFCREGDMVIYFSYESRFGMWKIAAIRKTISDLFPAATAPGATKE